MLLREVLNLRSWLIDIRKSKGLTQKAVAEKASITRQYYNFIELGQRGANLPVPTAKTIAKILGFKWQRFYDEDKNAS